MSTSPTRSRTQQPTRRHGRRVHAEQRRRPPFRSETGKHIGDYMAIVLDDRVMGRPPVIQSAIGTRGQITMGGKDLADAQDLALVLRPARCRCRSASPKSRNDRSEPRPGLDRQGHRAPASSPSRSSSSSCSATTASPACSRSAAWRCTCSTRWPRSPASTPCSRCPGSRASCSRSVSRSTRTC